MSINISGRNGVVIVNGKVISGGESQIAKLEITYEDGTKESEILGQVDKVIVHVDGDIHGDVVTVSGDVEAEGSIGGSVNTTSGDLEIGGSIAGSVSTMSGDVDVDGDVGGSVKTMSGDIKHRKK